jgi:hypothetical protein
MMTILKINKMIILLFIFFVSIQGAYCAPTDGGALCVKLSKRYHYLKNLNDKVTFLIDKNSKIKKSLPPRKVSLKKRLDVLSIKLELEKKKLKKKLISAELDLAKKKCPDYRMLSRYNL